MQLFNPDNGLSGVNLYLDLDVVILKNIDCFATFTNVKLLILHLILMVDRYGTILVLMKWNSERMHSIIWDEFIKDRQYWYRFKVTKMQLQSC